MTGQLSVNEFNGFKSDIYGASWFVSLKHSILFDQIAQMISTFLKVTAEQKWPEDSHLRTHDDKALLETSNLLYIGASEPPTGEMTNSHMGMTLKGVYASAEFI